jgi:hypothetical protein
MVDVRPATAKGQPVESTNTTLHQIDGGREGVSARAV